MTLAKHRRPIGVPLDQLEAGLAATTLGCERVGGSLVMTHEHYSLWASLSYTRLEGHLDGSR
jgi:hypothetical protein